MQSRSSQMLMKTGADIFCINVIIQELTPSQIGMLERSRPFAGVSGSVHFQKKKKCTMGLCPSAIPKCDHALQ